LSDIQQKYVLQHIFAFLCLQYKAKGNKKLKVGLLSVFYA